MDIKIKEGSKLYEVVSPYIKRIKDFFNYKKTDIELKSSLRHIEIIRCQIHDTVRRCDLSDLESEFIYSIITDSYYFERMKNESVEWKVHFLRFTWNRLLDALDEKIDDEKAEILKNTYVDSGTRVDGRHIYRKYEN